MIRCFKLYSKTNICNISNNIGNNIGNSNSSSRYYSTLLSKGVGAFGCLGHDYSSENDVLLDSDVFKPVVFPSSSSSSSSSQSSEHVIQISAGWGHSLAVTNNGTLYVFGRPYDFSNILQINRIRTMSHGIARLVSKHSNWFGINKNNESEEKDGGIYTIPLKVDIENEYILEAKASAGLSVLRTKNGRIYCFGLNRWGQCGINNTNNKSHIYKPNLVSIPKQRKFKAFDVGLQHVVAVSEDGEIFAWGKGNRGQLGNGEGDSSPTPVQVKFKGNRGIHLKNIVITEVSTGFNHSVALTNDGQVFIWGKGISDVLKGDTKFYEDQLTPRLLKLPNNIKATQICSSNFCTVIRGNDGSLWALGMSEYDRSMIINPVPVFAPIPDNEDNNDIEKFPDVPLIIPNTVKMFKGHQRVIVFYENKSSSIEAYEIILHQGEAFAKEVNVSIPSTYLTSSTKTTVLDYSHGWQHSLILIK